MSGKIEITPEMIEAGEEAILGEIGGADLGGYFSAYELAEKVYRAMARCDKKPEPKTVPVSPYKRSTLKPLPKKCS